MICPEDPAVLALGALKIVADEAGLTTTRLFSKALLASADGDVFTAREALDQAFISMRVADGVTEAQQQAAPEGQWKN